MKYFLIVVFGVLLAAWVTRNHTPPPKDVTYRELLGSFYSALSECPSDSHPLTDAGRDILAARELLLACNQTVERDAALRVCALAQSAITETLGIRSKALGNKRGGSQTLGPPSRAINPGAFLASALEPRWRERIAPLRLQAAAEWARIPASTALPEPIQIKAQALLNKVQLRLADASEIAASSEQIRVVIAEVVPGGAVVVPYMRTASRGASDQILQTRKIFLKGVTTVVENETITVLASRQPMGPVMTSRGQTYLEHWIFVKNPLSPWL